MQFGYLFYCLPLYSYHTSAVIVKNNQTVAVATLKKIAESNPTIHFFNFKANKIGTMGVDREFKRQSFLSQPGKKCKAEARKELHLEGHSYTF